MKERKTLAEQLRTLDEKPAKIEAERIASVRGVIDPPTLSRPAGYWQAAIAEPPNAWHRFWTWFLLGWKWIDCRKD